MIRIASLSKGEQKRIFGYVICWIIFSTAANGETGLFSKVEPACLKHIIRKEDDRVTG